MLGSFILILCFVSAGVIDRDYRGNIGVVLFNFSKTDYNGMLMLDIVVLLW